MERGTTKWFDQEKGYGFVVADEGKQEYFVHKSNLIDVGSLEQGQRVQFDIGEGRRGKQAVEVSPINQDEV